MTQDHPNVALLKRLDLRNLAGSADLFADDFVWHYFNSKLPDVEGDYAGLDGLQTFFRTVGAKSGGTFKVEPVSISTVGDELVITHVRDRLTIEGEPLVIDALAIWRVVDGRLAEGWDIPAVHTPVVEVGADDRHA